MKTCVCKNCECKKKEVLLFEVINYEFLEEIGALYLRFTRNHIGSTAKELVEWINEQLGEVVVKVGEVK